MPKWELLSEQQQQQVIDALYGDYKLDSDVAKAVYEAIRKALGIGD